MDFGLVAQTNAPARDVVELAQRAEDAGFTHFWTFDSCVLWQEPFVIYSQILANTSSIIVGPMVTNPVTRDWSVTASLFATLNEMYGPRTICGIGRGDSALRVTGGSPASLDTLGESIGVIKGLAEGREVVMNSRTVKIPWVKDGRLEVLMAAYGPKALAVAGAKADGLIMQLADPFIVNWASEQALGARANAGRTTSDYRVVVAAPAYVGRDLAHQRDQVRWFGGMVGNHVADIVERYGAASSFVPPALTDYIAGRRGYDYSHHGRADNPDVDFVPDDIIDRFCVLGEVQAHRDKLSELSELGVDQFSLYLMHDDPQGTIDAYRDEIIGFV
ncbi:MAG TPA: TIGR03842 family LLM class F420-dependent oxidoreductase [Acidimicrobiales bacterium]|nr:TIGR03842 family LLM class F420-dependent oxidoreductase [Acidimicrobiales bacterium]